MVPVPEFLCYCCGSSQSPTLALPCLLERPPQQRLTTPIYVVVLLLKNGRCQVDAEWMSTVILHHISKHECEFKVTIVRLQNLVKIRGLSSGHETYWYRADSACIFGRTVIWIFDVTFLMTVL